MKGCKDLKQQHAVKFAVEVVFKWTDDVKTSSLLHVAYHATQNYYISTLYAQLNSYQSWKWTFKYFDRQWFQSCSFMVLSLLEVSVASSKDSWYQADFTKLSTYCLNNKVGPWRHREEYCLPIVPSPMVKREKLRWHHGPFLLFRQ